MSTLVGCLMPNTLYTYINVQNKILNSLDFSLRKYAYQKCLNLLAIHLRLIKFKSSLPINTRINIRKHITNMTYFKFNSKFYKHKSGLPMGNSISEVLACLFLEF